MSRKSLLILLGLLLAGTLFAFPRKPLIEEMTSWTCGPCAASAPAFNSFMNSYGDSVAVCVYHANWPGAGNDPWFLRRPTLNLNRIQYYGVTGVPSCFMDGVTTPYPGDSQQLMDTFHDRVAIESPVQLTVTSRLQGSDLSVTVNITTGDEALPDSIDYRLHAAIVDGVTYLDNAPNGQEEWHHAMLEMAPDADGEMISQDANSTVEYDFTMPWDQEYDPDDSFITCWLQNNATKEVLQAEMIEFVSDYRIVVTPEMTEHLTNAGTAAVFPTVIANRGLFEDTYDISFEDNFPDDWTVTYTTPDGEQSGDATLTLGGQSDYSSTISVTPGPNRGESGTLTLSVASQAQPGNTWVQTYHVMSAPQVMVLCSDSLGLYDSYYSDALDAYAEGTTLSYGVWKEADHAFPTPDLGETDVEAVVWYDGNNGPIDPNVVDALMDYLNGGGNLWITGSTMPERLDPTGLLEMMGATYQTTYPTLVNISGVDGDPVGDGLDLSLDGGDGAGDRAVPTTMSLTGDGTASLLYGGLALRRAAVRNETANYRSMIFGFPFEAISTQENRNLMMARVMDYFQVELAVPERETGNGDLPSRYNLSQNYPNPFNPTTEIRFDLVRAQHARISVYNSLGQEVARLADQQYAAGTHTVSFDGAGLASGIYFYRLETPAFSSMKKMVLMK